MKIVVASSNKNLCYLASNYFNHFCIQNSLDFQVNLTIEDFEIDSQLQEFLNDYLNLKKLLSKKKYIYSLKENYDYLLFFNNKDKKLVNLKTIKQKVNLLDILDKNNKENIQLLNQNDYKLITTEILIPIFSFIISQFKRFKS